MKIGPIELYYNPGTTTTILDHLRADPEVRALIAKMARAEVKNYLAELAEAANLPFSSAAGFLTGLKVYITDFGSTTNLAAPADEPCQCTCAGCSGCTVTVPADDSPFNVFDKVTLHPADEDGEH
jgi:hypothetical protein